MSDIFDGGPVFPTPWTNDSDILNHAPDGQAVLPGGTVTLAGMSKRELFAAILMHSEAVTCGVPGEACEALVEASRAADTDVIEQMAMNAVQGADALLRALAAPLVREPEPIPPHLSYDGWTTPETQHKAIKRIAQQPDFAELPEFLRNFITLAVASIDDAEDGIPF
jgi:hypothetical protein